MSDIHVHRPHTLGLAEARALLRRWQPMAEDKLALHCTLAEDAGGATLTFARMGARGTFRASAETFEIACTLGLIFKPMRSHFQKTTEAYLDAAIARAQADAARQAAGAA